MDVDLHRARWRAGAGSNAPDSEVECIAACSARAANSRRCAGSALTPPAHALRKGSIVKKTGLLALGALVVSGLGYAARQVAITPMGRQQDGSFVVSSGQRIEPGAIAFDRRPIDLALHPSGGFFAVLNQQNVFLADRNGVIAGSEAPLAAGASYRGAVWAPDGARLYVSVSDGYVQALDLHDRALALGSRIEVRPADAKENPRPGGMAITRDGSRLYVALCDRNAVAEIDLTANDRYVREFPVQNLPFQVRLSADEKTLIVSDWGGRKAKGDDETSGSGNALIVVD